MVLKGYISINESSLKEGRGGGGVRRRGRGQVCMLAIKLLKQMAPAST